MITKSESTDRIIYGPLVHSISLREYKAFPKALIAISGDTGTIAWIEEAVESSSIQEATSKNGWSVTDGNIDVIELGEGEWIMPGFVDTHTHAPQYPNMGIGGQYELLDWLKHVTFPTEAKFADLDYARTTYTSVVQRVLNCGTTTCCYYGSMHLEATKALADIVHEKGQRGYVGKCNMDRNAAEFYQETSADQSISDTKSLIGYIRSLPTTLVKPILTPRFAITCSDALLEGLKGIAKSDPDLNIQTHISENASEIIFTKSLFPDCTTYAGVYDKFGLLRNNTILGHACLLEDEELDLVKERSAGISHCPTSNFNLRSGLARVGEMLDRGIKVGLGTDVSGGYAPSILTTIQHASICSKIVSLQTPPASATGSSFASKQLPLATLLYLATLGGADLCGISSKVGNFAPGKEFDALLINCSNATNVPGIWFDKSRAGGDGAQFLEELLERFLTCGDDRNISRVWVKNRTVGGNKYAI